MKNKYYTVYKFHSKVQLIDTASFLGKNSVDLEESSTKTLELKTPRIKEVLKERKVLEKKVALSKRRKKDSRYMLYLAVFPL